MEKNKGFSIKEYEDFNSKRESMMRRHSGDKRYVGKNGLTIAGLERMLRENFSEEEADEFLLHAIHTTEWGQRLTNSISFNLKKRSPNLNVSDEKIEGAVLEMLHRRSKKMELQ